jgi:hypothetical protein
MTSQQDQEHAEVEEVSAEFKDGPVRLVIVARDQDGGRQE